MSLTAAQHGTAPPRKRRRWWKGLLALTAVLAFGSILAAEYVLHHAEPILRNRIMQTLSARFNAPVELDRLEISLFKGIEVNGWGLRIPYSAGTVPVSPIHPMIAVAHFAFHTGLLSLFQQPMHVARVRVDGVELHIPPPSDHDRPTSPRQSPPKVDIVVTDLICTDVRLFLESGRPGPDNGHKPPLELNVSSIYMHNVGRNQAMLYDAELTNPKPVGQIHAVGHFGPWARGVPGGQPGETPLDGDYSFDHADLSTLPGISGTLSSRGHFAGVLERITVDGHTDTPNFALDISNHALPLRTDFHALVDGQTGDTFLQPVHVWLAGSEFTTSGKVVKGQGQGHDIQLDVDIPHGRMQDFLRLATKTEPPLLNGTLTMRARLRIPPGKERVPEKLSLEGSFSLTGARFNNTKTQNQIDGLSARALGEPKQVAQASHDHRAEASSQIAANIAIKHGVMAVSDLRFSVPGALVLMNGVYSMDGRLFEFKGHARTQATASAMVGGWKGLLLKPFDHLLERNGAGLELPVEVSGTEGDLHLGLAEHGTGDTPAQMLADVKNKARAQQSMSSARSEAAEADAEDLKAAHAATLEEAEHAHAAAVRLRAEAQARAAAAQKTADHPRP